MKLKLATSVTLFFSSLTCAGVLLNSGCSRVGPKTSIDVMLQEIPTNENGRAWLHALLEPAQGNCLVNVGASTESKAIRVRSRRKSKGKVVCRDYELDNKYQQKTTIPEGETIYEISDPAALATFDVLHCIVSQGGADLPCLPPDLFSPPTYFLLAVGDSVGILPVERPDMTASCYACMWNNEKTFGEPLSDPDLALWLLEPDLHFGGIGSFISHAVWVFDELAETVYIAGVE